MMMNDDEWWLWMIMVNQWSMNHDKWWMILLWMKMMNDPIMNENYGWCKNGNELNDELIMNLECYVLSTGFF